MSTQPAPLGASFDRAAGYYDESRGLPPAVSTQVAQATAGVVAPGARVLEIGVGTGRIARPLLAAGLRVWGVDVSLRMMQRLVETQPLGQPAPHLAQADARHLPLQPSVFDAVVAVHVLHLIDDWRAALHQAMRVLKPDGALLIGYNEPDRNSDGRRIRRQWKSIVNAHGVDGGGPGGSELDHVRAELIAGGATLQTQTAAQWVTRSMVGREIAQIEQQVWSATWHVPADILALSVAQLRQWALAEYGALDTEFDVDNKFVWQVYRWDHKTLMFV